jgi:hypothetical protein
VSLYFNKVEGKGEKKKKVVIFSITPFGAKVGKLKTPFLKNTKKFLS